MGCFGVTSGYSQPRIIRLRTAIRFPKIIVMPVTKRGVSTPERGKSFDVKSAILLIYERFRRDMPGTVWMMYYPICCS